METNQTKKEPPIRRGFWLVVLGVGLGAVALSYGIKQALPKPHSGLPAGESAPELEAAGWLNGEAPSRLPAPGTIRVMHAWFTSCPACLKETPELVKLHAKHQGQGVEFVGLTFEPPEKLNDVEDYLQTTGITWVNGYGGLKTLQQFGVEYFPSTWIIGPAGRILWNRDSDLPLKDAIPLALDGKLPEETRPHP